MDFYLFLDALAALFTFIASINYFMKHPNGKKWIRFVTACIMMYVFVIHLLAFVGILDPQTYGRIFLRPFLFVVYLIPVWDIWVDWQKYPKHSNTNQKNKAEIKSQRTR